MMEKFSEIKMGSQRLTFARAKLKWGTPRSGALGVSKGSPLVAKVGSADLRS